MNPKPRYYPVLPDLRAIDPAMSRLLDALAREAAREALARLERMSGGKAESTAEQQAKE